MRILILSDNFPPSAPGGAERSTFDLAQAFLKKGHKVFVITASQDKTLCGESTYEGLKVFRIYANYRSRWKAYLSLYNPQTVGKVKKLLQEIKPDIVSAQNIHYYLSYFSLRLARKYAKRVFFTARDMLTFSYGKMPAEQYMKRGHYKTSWLDHLKQAKKRYNPFRNIVIRHYLKYADKIFAISHSLKEVLRQNGIQNVEVIHNGISLETWRENLEETEKFKEKYRLQDKKAILFGGRLSDELKGGEKIIQAMEKVVKEVPEAVLLVAGKEGKSTKELLKFAQKLGIENNIIFTGWLDGEKLKASYFASDIVAVPSLYVTTFNRFNMEAMAAKKPVVGTCFGGATEIVKDQETGYMINPFDTELMAEKIIDLLKNPQKAKQFGEAGYLRVKEKFNLEEKANEYLTYFEKI